MDIVLAICDNYAILEKVSPSVLDASKELQALTDVKLRSDKDYLEKQVKPYLQLYGRRLAIDARYHVLSMNERGLPDAILRPLGYCEYENQETGRFHLHRIGRDDNNTYVAPIRGVGASGVGVDGAAGCTLSDLQDAMAYAAKLALLSKDGENRGLPISVERDKFEMSVVSFGQIPKQFWFCPEWMPLENVFGSSRDSIAEHHGSVGRDGDTFHVTLLHHAFNYIKESADVVRFAASLLLVCLMRTYHFGCGQYVVDHETGGISKQTPSNLLQSVVEFTAAGKVHECPYCKRPVFGNSVFCRNGGCYQRMSEKAQAQLEVGLPLEEVLSKYGKFFKRKTIEQWADREGR